MSGPHRALRDDDVRRGPHGLEPHGLVPQGRGPHGLEPQGPGPHGLPHGPGPHGLEPQADRHDGRTEYAGRDGHDEGRTAAPRILVATAVPPERDAVAAAFDGPAREVRLPAGSLHTPPSPAVPPGPGAPGPDMLGPYRAGRWDLLAAGVGPASAAAGTAAALTAAALDGRPYGLVVCAGIGGGFAPAAPLGTLVVADAITVADLGATTADGFVPVTALGFGTVTHRPPPSLVRAAAGATGAVTGTVLTVSTVTGTAARAAELRARHPGAVAEAMEGFGVAEAAAAHGVPVLEIRAISNPVGPRDRAAWRVDAAFTALTEAFGRLRDVLAGPSRPYWKEATQHDAPG